jgi:hypothetical protein
MRLAKKLDWKVLNYESLTHVLNKLYLSKSKDYCMRNCNNKKSHRHLFVLVALRNFDWRVKRVICLERYTLCNKYADILLWRCLPHIFQMVNRSSQYMSFIIFWYLHYARKNARTEPNTVLTCWPSLSAAVSGQSRSAREYFVFFCSTGRM